jgi:hypothetical protein
MTKLEVLCQGLRAINRPDLAQRLEGRTAADWDAYARAWDRGMGAYAHDSNPHSRLAARSTGESASQVLMGSFHWSSTPEVRSGKVDYGTIYQALGRWERVVYNE